MCRIAEPVLSACAERRLKRDMPIESKSEERKLFTHLEALSRTLTGIAPWIELVGAADVEEERIRKRMAELARQAIDAGTDPESPDYMNFSVGLQPIVDVAFLSQAILRAPNELWEKLDLRVRSNVIRALKATRSRKPFYDNWLLFCAMTEAALYRMGEEWDRTFTYDKLNLAFQAVRKGARTIATNPDRTCPVDGGEVPDAAGMIGAIEGVTGKKVDVIAGKPSLIMGEAAIRNLGLKPEECLMVGDRPETDILMGKQAGMRTALVMTGITKQEHLGALPVQPDMILNSIKDLIRLGDS
jgi:ribonucleotide monophosphatase NagD (HAD superfamily)